MDNRVWNRIVFDQLLLGELRAHVAAFGKSLRADDRQRDMMAHACRRLGLEQICGRRLEKLQCRSAIKCWRVGEVYNNRRFCERIGESAAGHGVDTRGA